MYNNSIRAFRVLFIALCLLVAIVSSVYAQRSEPVAVDPARIQMPDGQPVAGPHTAINDLIIVCPFERLAAENHPCNRNNAPPSIEPIDDKVLVCPIKEVLDPAHPCSGRSRSIELNNGINDLKLVCPFEPLRNPEHPCNRDSSKVIRFSIPDDYKLTCPIKEVLDPRHPCFDD